MAKTAFALLFVGLCAVTGCLLGEPINEAPRVTIDVPPTLYRGQATTVAARVDDDDPGAASVQWGRSKGDCPQNILALGEDMVAARGSSWTFRVDGTDLTDNPNATLCFWATVTDRHGARAEAHATAMIVNRAPTGGLAISGPSLRSSGVRLRTTVRLDVTALDPDPDDGAHLKTEVSVDAPDGSRAATMSCPGPGATNVPPPVCFVAQLTGTYRAHATVTDPWGGVATTDLAVDVLKDQPPCINSVSAGGLPEAWDASQALILSDVSAPVHFSVQTVVDDVDPWPPDGAIQASPFTWAYRSVGDPQFHLIAGPSSSRFDLPAESYVVGDEVEVRVAYSDAAHRIDLLMPPAGCSEEDPGCSIAADGCFQWITWRVRYLSLAGAGDGP